MFFSCDCCVLSGRGLCDGLIPRPEGSYRLWCVSECDQVKINNLNTYCEQVGRRGKDYETKLKPFCSWLRHCTTNRKVAGSIPKGIIGICNGLNPSGPGFDSNRNEYQEYFLGGKGGRCVGLTAMCRLSKNLGASTSWNPNGLSRPVMGLLYSTRVNKCIYYACARLYVF
jgi:hypothetical protein